MDDFDQYLAWNEQCSDSSPVNIVRDFDYNSFSPIFSYFLPSHVAINSCWNRMDDSYGSALNNFAFILSRDLPFLRIWIVATISIRGGFVSRSFSDSGLSAVSLGDGRFKTSLLCSV